MNNKFTKRAVPEKGFSQTSPTFHENERFSQEESMRSHQKAVLSAKITDFLRICPLQTQAWTSGILEFWNSTTPEMASLKAPVVPVFPL